MSPAIKKTNAPQTRNQKQVAALEERLKEMGPQSITLPRLLELVNLTDTIKRLKENPGLTIF